VKRFAGVVLILTLAACSKQEPPPATTAASPKVAPAPATPPPAATPDPAATAALLKQGDEIFQNTCATCHMADGYGVPNLQPQIVGSGWISAPDPQLLLSLILRGSAILGEAAKAYENDMAPQDHLTDTEIAAVASYVRQRFATPPITEPVTPAQVAIARSRPGLPE
jgi:mono/diheme cytochrome c family protein